MGSRFYLSIAIGTVILFAWNAVSWMALPFHTNSLNDIPESALETARMKEAMPESGVYHFPGLPKDNSTQELERIGQKLKEGPRITLMVYSNKPSALYEPVDFLFSLLINLLTVAFTAFLISKSSSDGKNIVLITILIGVISLIVSDLSQMNWFKFPLGYTMVNALDKVVAFGLLGLLFSRYTFKSKVEDA